MTQAASDLLELINTHQSAILAGWQVQLAEVGGSYTAASADWQAEMLDVLLGLKDILASSEGTLAIPREHRLANTLRNSSGIHAARGLTPEEAIQFVQGCKNATLAIIDTHGPADVSRRHRDVLTFERLIDRCVVIVAASFVSAREAVILRQAESLRETSAPVIQVWESILLMPLVGIVDSVRARHISERLLDEIGRTEAVVTLIDVTGVPVMDTSVARHILKTVAAAEMLGTKVILTGISPNTAQTIVKLGIDLSGVPTRGSLKAGLALAMALTQRMVVDKRAD